MKTHVFVDKNGRHRFESSVSFLSNVISDSPVDNYADLIQDYLKLAFSSKPASLKSIPIELKFPIYNENTHYWSNTSVNSLEGKSLFRSIGQNKYARYSVVSNANSEYDYKSSNYKNSFLGYSVKKINDIEVVNGKLIDNSLKEGDSGKLYSQQDIINMSFEKLFVVLEDGREIAYQDAYAINYY